MSRPSSFPRKRCSSTSEACATAAFWGHFLISAYRVTAGIVLGWLLAFPVGVAMGYGRRIDRVFAPLVFITYPVPKIVLLPLVLLIFGLGDLSKIVLITSILFFQVLVATRDGVRAIDEKYYDSLRSLGADDRVMLREVAFPAALPHSFTALRIGIGTAVSVLFFVESFATTTGLGYLIMDAWASMDYARLWNGIVGMGLLGMLLYEALGAIEPRLCPWMHPAGSEEPEGAVAQAIVHVGAGPGSTAASSSSSTTVFALPFALAASSSPCASSPSRFRQGFSIVVAMVGRRSAAMGFNRLVDAAIDGKNPRTADRELPSGRMTRGETAFFVAASASCSSWPPSLYPRRAFWCSFIVLASSSAIPTRSGLPGCPTLSWASPSAWPPWASGSPSRTASPCGSPCSPSPCAPISPASTSSTPART